MAFDFSTAKPNPEIDSVSDGRKFDFSTAKPDPEPSKDAMPPVGGGVGIAPQPEKYSPLMTPPATTLVGKAVDYVLSQGGRVDPHDAPVMLARDALGAVESMAGVAPIGTAKQFASQALRVAEKAASNVSSPAKTLMAAGVKLTPGQMAGGMAKATENKATSIPLLGDQIKNAYVESVKSWNIATANKVLAPIGAKVGAGVQAGHDLIKYTANKVSKAYDAAHEGLTFKADKNFLISLKQVADEYAPSLGEEAGKVTSKIEHLVQNKLFNKVEVKIPAVFDDMGYLVKEEGKKVVFEAKQVTGKVLQRVRSEIRARAKSLSGSTVDADKQAARALEDADYEIGRALMQQNPAKAAALKSADASFAQLVRMEEAAARSVSKGGVFGANDLLAVSKRLQGGRMNSVYARGDALLQDWGLMAQEVIPSVVPDSGTAGRAALGLMATKGAAMLGGVGEKAAAAAAAGALGGASLYTKPAISALNSMAMGSAPSLATSVQYAVPFAGASLGDLTR